MWSKDDIDILMIMSIHCEDCVSCVEVFTMTSVPIQFGDATFRECFVFDDFNILWDIDFKDPPSSCKTMETNLFDWFTFMCIWNN